MISKIIAAALVLLVTRYLSTEEYGQLALIRLFLAVSSLAIFAMLSGSFGVVYSRLTGKERRQFVGSAIIFLLIAMFLGVALLSLVGQTALEIIFPKTALDFFPTVWTGLMSLVFSVPQFILAFVYQLEQKPRQYAALQLGPMILSTVLVVLFVIVLRLSVLGMMLSDAVVNLLVSMVSFYLLRRYSDLSLSWKPLRVALTLSLPILPTSLWTLVVNQADRYILEKHVGIAQIGFYSLGMQFGGIMNLVVIGMTAAVSPLMYRLFATSGPRKAAERMWSLMGPIVFVWVLMFVGISFFSKEVIFILLRPPYHASYQLVPPLAFAFLIRGLVLFYQDSYYYAGQLKYFIPSTLITGVSLWAILLIFVPLYGTLAAAGAWIAYYLISLVVDYGLSQRIFGLKFHVRAAVLVLVAGIIVLGVMIGFPARLSYAEVGLKILLLVSIPPLAVKLDLITWGQIKSGCLSVRGRLVALRKLVRVPTPNAI